MTAARCPRCDDPACDVPAANVEVSAIRAATDRDPDGSRWALSRLGLAAAACLQRPAVDWRARAIAAEARCAKAEQERDEMRAELHDSNAALLACIARMGAAGHATDGTTLADGIDQLAAQRDSAHSDVAILNAALVEARAEVERLTREYTQMRHNRNACEDERQRAVNACDSFAVEVARLRAEPSAIEEIATWLQSEGHELLPAQIRARWGRR